MSEINLSEEQLAAVALARSHRISIVTGGPGTGKTATIKAIVAAAQEAGLVQCMAPTGKAAKRMSECLDGMIATTIHRALGFDPATGGFKHGATDPLPGMTLIMDEATMADLSLLASVLDAMRPEARIVFVGDVDQLPSVGPGTCFRDLIASGVVPVARLTKIYRQCEGSRIATNCRAINAGEMPEFEDAADSFFCAAEPEEIWPQIESIYLDRIASFAYRAEDVQVLTPQRKTDNGIDSLNLRLQALLNPDVGQDAWTFPTKTFRLGERVIQKKNNYQIQSLDGCEPGCFNGEVGKVVEFRGYGQGERMIVDMGDRKLAITKQEAGTFELAYALTIHSSQGSEFPAAIVVATSQHSRMQNRCLFYTAMSRPKQHVWVVGDERAMAKAVRTITPHERRGRLVARLRAVCA